MDSFNTVGLVGWLDVDLSTRWQGDASQCTTFTVRLEEHGADKVHRVYVPVECWGKTAECTADLTPGDLIGVQGKLVYRRGDPTGRLMVLASRVVCLVPTPAGTASDTR